MVSIGFSDVLYALDLLIFTQPGLSEGRSPQYYNDNKIFSTYPGLNRGKVTTMSTTVNTTINNSTTIIISNIAKAFLDVPMQCQLWLFS